MKDFGKPNDADKILEPFEEYVTNWESAVAKINLIIERSQLIEPRELVWRGVTDSKFWPDNSLYRYLTLEAQKSSDPKLRHPPFEDDMKKFENELLKVARTLWRFDHLSALEIFAHVRHFGGLTRLLDVTYNPLIALWFAVERQEGVDDENVDVRLYAFDVTEKKALLDANWGGRDLPWDSQLTLPARKLFGDEPYWIWKPPSYNERIPAQNSAFLVSKIASLDELLWRYGSDPIFNSLVDSVPNLVTSAQSTFGELSHLSSQLGVRDKFLKAREIFRRLTSIFESLNLVAEKVDSLIMERRHLERMETGGRFQPIRLNIDQQVAVFKGISGDAVPDAENWTDSYDDYVKHAPEQDLEDLLNNFKEDSEQMISDLSWFGEQVLEIRNWIMGVGDETGPTSIAMEFVNAMDVGTPGPFTTYTIRIAAEAKDEIRAKLERNYGYNAFTMYPDLMGLARKGMDFMFEDEV